MASKSQASAPNPNIPDMIQSLLELYQNLSSVLPKPAGGNLPTSTEAMKLKNLLVNIEHLKEALEKTSELDEKLNKPIQSIKASVEEVIQRIGPNPMSVNDLNIDFVDAISKDMKTLKFQIPSYKKLSLAGTTAYLVDSGLATAEQNKFRLPNLYGHKVFDESPVYNEIKGIYDGFDKDFLGLTDVCKNCFLYFAVFPENVVFKKRFLTYWWIGEGLFEDHEMPELCTSKILEQFTEKGLIVPVKEDQKMIKKKFRMPPIVRSAAMKLAKDNNFLDYDKENNPIAKRPACDRIFLVKREGSNELEVPTKLQKTKKKSKEEIKSISNVCQPFLDRPWKWLPEVLTGTTKMPMAPTDAKVPAGMTKPMNLKTPMGATELTHAKAPAGMMEPTDLNVSTSTTTPRNMEVLTDQKLQERIKSIFNVSQPFPDSALEWLAKQGDVDMRTVKAVEWLLKLKNLEVLYLGRWQSEVDEQQIEVESYEFLEGLKNMKKLKLLSLQGISWINKLPNSLRTLSKLRVLDLKSCFNLEQLPQDIGFLKNLTHLDVSGCYMLNEMPKSISKLVKLTVLKGFISGRSNLNDLRNLKKLKKLSINISRTDFPNDKDLSVLQKLGEYGVLRSLTIMWGSGGVKKEEVKKEPSSGGEVEQLLLGERVNQPSSGGGVEKPSTEEEVKQPSLGEGVNQPSSGGGVEKPSSGEGGKQPSWPKRNMIRQITMKLQPKEPEKVLCLPKELEKLEVHCLPKEKLPQWLNPSNLKSLKRLYIRGGKLEELGNAEWKTEVVRLKYMKNLKIEWRELLKSFPNLRYLQKVQCPNVTLCPCDANGVWMKP